MTTCHVALGGFHLEAATTVAGVTGREALHVRTGHELLDYYPFLNTPRWHDLAQVDTRTAPAHPLVRRPLTLHPTIHARALPGAPMDATTFREGRMRFLHRLHTLREQGTLDAVLLDVHGAATVEGKPHGDVEGELARDIKRLFGDDVIIAAPLDLHGNVSDLLLEHCDIITAYRTAPHTDEDETRERALLLIESLFRTRDSAGWGRTRLHFPILLPGEKTSTEVEPGKTLYTTALHRWLDMPGVQDVAILMGYPWADQPRCQASVVVTHTNEVDLEAVVSDIRTEFTNAAFEFEFVGPTASVEEAVAQAVAPDAPRPFFVSDTGDNPGAGGTGNTTVTAAALLTHADNCAVVVASIHDPEAVVALRRGERTVAVGDARLELSVDDVRFYTSPVGGECAAVTTGRATVLLTTQREQYGTREAFERAGVDIDGDHVIMVKMGYLEPDLSAAARGWVMALSPGSVDQDLTRLEFTHLPRPLIPFDTLTREQFTHHTNVTTISPSVSRP